MQRPEQLKLMANRLRMHSINATTAAGSGHPTSCLSCADIMSVLFFDEMKEEDEFIMSKGHAAPILWAAYAEAGIIPVSKLNTLRKITSELEGHPTPRMPMVKVATGSLGQGLSAGLGMAMAKRLNEDKGRVFVLMGDGEISEGSVWEAANSAAYFRADHLVAIVDGSRLGQSQPTMHGHDLDAYRKKFRAFGWDAKVIDGHNIVQIQKALRQARRSKRPFAIIARTIKGKGVSFLEDVEGWHGKALSRDESEKALAEIGPVQVSLHSEVRHIKPNPKKFHDIRTDDYKTGDLVATRVAFGRALVRLGLANKHVVVVDGDVKNSTMTLDFFNTFRYRSFESFIAEQNMVGMCVGFASQGLIPFTSTFATFFTRAHDFIRMAAYSKANIKIVGSHAGVSIGEDGPSQMGLEDLPMYLSIPGAVVLYPCDAVSAERCTVEMAKHDGLAYLRTTREKTPVIYKSSEKFPIGKLKVLRSSGKDRALVVAAGVTVHEALKAYDSLKKRRINIRVIDLYSLKPVDRAALLKNAKECGNRVVTVEDHYFGGLGSVVAEVVGRVEQLYVKGVPRSGKPEQLRRMFRIDDKAVVDAVLRATK
ncbi:transketolase [Candidatus Woesearchaeota archaeon]|nr:transketolase [Candidatus Woesearchaeota archaeon]